MKRLPLLLIAAAILVLAVAACNSGSPATTQPTNTPTVVPTATPKAPAPVSAAGSGTSAAPAGQATPASGPTAVKDLGALELTTLRSYVANMEYKEEMLKPTPTVGNWGAMTLRFVGEPAPGMYAMNISDKTGQQEETKVVVAGGNTYMFMGDQGKWLKAPSRGGEVESITGEVLDPNKLAESAPSGLFTKQNVVNDNETLDGVATTHYRASNAQLKELMGETTPGGQQTTVVTGSADFWVAKKGGYLKQYILQATVEDAGGQQFGQYAKLSVTDENKPVSIEVPAGDQVMDMPSQDGLPGATGTPQASALPREQLEAALKALPTPTGSQPATDAEIGAARQLLQEAYVPTGGPMLTIMTPGTLADTGKFFQTELAKAGWTMEMNDEKTAPGKSTFSVFTKDEMTLMVVTVHDDAGNRNLVRIEIQ